MPALTTPKAELNWHAPNFKLKDTEGNFHTLETVKGEHGLVVMFICNHCPYVQAIIDKITRDMRELKSLGIGAIAIMANDVTQYPEDGIKNMRVLAQEKHFSFPYVIDETQEVAKAYGAVCTPDFFGFNKDLTLQYRGRLDSSARSNDPNATRELFLAMSEIAHTGYCSTPQHSSIGCSIKWR